MIQSKEKLTLELKQHIISYLNLNINIEEIKNDTPLFGPESELELDSIDSIELIVLLDREYGIKITDPREGRSMLVDINSMVDYIIAHQQ